MGGVAQLVELRNKTRVAGSSPAATQLIKGNKMETINGREFKLTVLGSGLRMRQVYERAKVSSGSVHGFVNDEANINVGTYNRLVTAFNELSKNKITDFGGG